MFYMDYLVLNVAQIIIKTKYMYPYSIQRKRRRIDRTMIGLPTNFVHTGHIGAGDVAENGSTVSNFLAGLANSQLCICNLAAVSSSS